MGLPLPRAAPGGRLTVLRRAISLFLPLLMVAMLFIANQQPVLGFVFAGAIAGLLILLAVGIERGGTTLVVIGFVLAPMDNLRPIGVVTFSDLFIALGFLLLIPSMIHRHARVPSTYGIGAFILLAVGLLASMLGPDPALSVLVMMRLVAAAIVLPILFVWWQPSIRVIDAMAKGYVFGALISLAYALLSGPQVNGRYIGLSTHVNYFGHTALLAVALCLYLMHRVKPSRRWIVLVSAGLLGWSVLLSGSRAAALVLVVMLILYPLIERSALTSTVILLGGGAALPLVSWALTQFGEDSPISRLLGNNTTESSDDSRLQGLEESFERWLENPLIGNGFSNAPLQAHNIYLQVAVVVGALGLVGFLMIGWSILKVVFNVHHPLHRLGYAALAYAGIGMLTNSLWDRFTWTVLALAMLANYTSYAEQQRPPTLEPVEPIEPVRPRSGRT